MSKTGKLYGIGVGPGSPDLLTLKAVRILQEVPLIFVPRGERGERSRALEIISPFLRDQEVREFVAPMTRDRSALDRMWRQAGEEVLAVLDEGKDAAFLTLGDSLLYSTYSYLLETLLRLRPGLEVETVPGIASFSAAAALCNRALCCGQESLAVVPATRGMGFLKEVLNTFENVVLLKVAPVFDELLALLAEVGRLDEAAYICRCGMEGQFLLGSLAAAAEVPRDYFSLVLVGNKKGREGGHGL